MGCLRINEAGKKELKAAGEVDYVDLEGPNAVFVVRFWRMKNTEPKISDQAAEDILANATFACADQW